ncbi:hypothetical protein RH915_05010 [Serpentinicella sp. ANB-PHB4]|uniref:hypothetical protein n=1 Tax=Serpentinicella sp. ANB-PHB4 TaxID=3074076 RepID=UPI0028570945|nr:hypothetical protein [Serpentinicella sp. ANB-PHB4]MDR5658842.1 hypothetical protein [Serpentinicella sp. ANB-PHB4]
MSISEKQGFNWFRKKEVHQEENLPKQPQLKEETQTSENPSITSLSHKEKVIVDVEVAVEQIIKDRQLKMVAIKDLEAQLTNANQKIDKLKQDVQTANKKVNEQQMEKKQLEEELTLKKLNFDQLLEDYGEYQVRISNEVEEVNFALEKEQEKYRQLSEDYKQFRISMAQQIKTLEETIREKEIENQKLVERHKKIQEEKVQLLKSFSDFTERVNKSTSSYHNNEEKSAEKNVVDFPDSNKK